MNISQELNELAASDESVPSSIVIDEMPEQKAEEDPLITPKLKKSRKLFQERFINATEATNSFMTGKALHGIDEKYLPYFEDFFLSSAQDPENIHVYYDRLRSIIEKSSDHIIVPEKSDVELEKDPTLEAFEKRDFRAAALKRIDELKIKKDSSSHSFADEKLEKQFRHKFSNADEAVIPVITHSILTRNYPGYPNTHIIMKCFMATQLEPDKFADHYLQMVKDFEQFGIKKYPDHKKLDIVFKPGHQALKINFDLDSHAQISTLDT